VTVDLHRDPSPVEIGERTLGRRAHHDVLGLVDTTFTGATTGCSPST
jgi:hypothetical protein